MVLKLPDPSCATTKSAPAAASPVCRSFLSADETHSGNPSESKRRSLPSDFTDLRPVGAAAALFMARDRVAY
ncbi:hypothetical protein SLA2020_100260 [Shorea laevis]